LSALDAPLRKKLAQEIRTLQKEFGFTGIMVTHDIAEAKTVSDKIILIREGKLVWQGAAEDFKEEMISG
ncbi:MAG: ABC transporter ATP-binding protein, partial [Treponema sp.]|nr:ABC transporter ATP-binding protein [Treponema sp.]